MAKPKLGVIQKTDKSFIKSAYAPFAEVARPKSRSLRVWHRSDDWKSTVPECITPERQNDFFPTKQQKAMEKSVKQTCAECPLFYVCAEKQLLDPDDEGIRAAMTARQRRALRQTIGSQTLDVMALLPPGNNIRDAFFAVTKVVVGAAVLHEIPIEEARQMIDQIPMPQEIAKAS